MRKYDVMLLGWDTIYIVHGVVMGHDGVTMGCMPCFTLECPSTCVSRSRSRPGVATSSWGHRARSAATSSFQGLPPCATCNRMAAP